MKMQSKSLSIVIVFATLYPALTLGLYPVSYGQVQIRISDALYPLIGLFGFPALLGCVIGHAIANLFSPLGIIDMMSVLFFVPAKIAIWKWKFKGVPLHVLSVALWVPYILHLLFGVPYLPTVFYVGTGEAVAELILGRWLYLEVERRIGK